MSSDCHLNLAASLNKPINILKQLILQEKHQDMSQTPITKWWNADSVD